MHSLPGQEPGGDDLPGKFRDPIQIPDVVGDPEEHDYEGRPEDREDRSRFSEDEVELRQLRRDSECGDDAEEHRDATESRCRSLMDVTLANGWVEPILHSEPGDHGCQYERDYCRKAASTDIDD